MPVALRLLPLLKDEKVRNTLLGIAVCLALLLSPLDNIRTVNNLQWYGNNTVASDFAPLVSKASKKIDDGSINTQLLYASYIVLFDNEQYPDKEHTRKRLIKCFYHSVTKIDDQGNKTKKTYALTDENSIFNHIEDEFHISISQDQKDGMEQLLNLLQTGSNYIDNSNIPNGNGTFILPIQKGKFRISSGFGRRTDPITGGTEFHKGIDLAAPKGTPIHASAAGTVIYAQFASHPYSGYGNLVVIRNSSSLVTMYGHCSELLVSVGQTVQQGQIIAKVGSTGNSTGNHCHFEIRLNGSSVNPLPYLS